MNQSTERGSRILYISSLRLLCVVLFSCTTLWVFSTEMYGYFWKIKAIGATLAAVAYFPVNTYLLTYLESNDECIDVQSFACLVLILTLFIPLLCLASNISSYLAILASTLSAYVTYVLTEILVFKRRVFSLELYQLLTTALIPFCSLLLVCLPAGIHNKPSGLTEVSNVICITSIVTIVFSLCTAHIVYPDFLQGSLEFRIGRCFSVARRSVGGGFGLMLDMLYPSLPYFFLSTSSQVLPILALCTLANRIPQALLTSVNRYICISGDNFSIGVKSVVYKIMCNDFYLVTLSFIVVMLIGPILFIGSSISLENLSLYSLYALSYACFLVFTLKKFRLTIRNQTLVSTLTLCIAIIAAIVLISVISHNNPGSHLSVTIGFCAASLFILLPLQSYISSRG